LANKVCFLGGFVSRLNADGPQVELLVDQFLFAVCISG
jgi:hypothetical protein